MKTAGTGGARSSEGVGDCEGVSVREIDGVALGVSDMVGVPLGDTPSVKLGVGVAELLGVSVLLALKLPVGEAEGVGEVEGVGEEDGVGEAEGGGGEGNGDGRAPSATVSVAVRCVPVFIWTKMAWKVTAPVPAEGAVQVPEAEVTLVALGCVMPPAHEDMARASAKGADTAPALAAAKEPGNEAPAKPATAKPFQASVPLSCSVCAAPGV